MVRLLTGVGDGAALGGLSGLNQARPREAWGGRRDAVSGALPAAAADPPLACVHVSPSWRAPRRLRGRVPAVCEGGLTPTRCRERAAGPTAPCFLRSSPFCCFARVAGQVCRSPQVPAASRTGKS